MASYEGALQIIYLDGGGVINPDAGVITTLSNAHGSTFSVGQELTALTNTGVETSGKFAGTVTIAGTTLVVFETDAGDLQLVGGAEQLSRASFPDSASGLTINESVFTVCFLAGTAIATPSGARPVEDLAIGDPVLTADGRTAPVRWIGVQTVVRVFADPLRTLPIRISTGALGEGLPARDLFVSPDHALFLDGVLVQAGALVNGTTIARVTEMPERFTYFHVELEDHALILAEGVPAETFVDNVTRRRFDNFAEFVALYGETGASIAELDLPRVKAARQLPGSLRARIAPPASQSEAA
jgi:hypothetical protein